MFAVVDGLFFKTINFVILLGNLKRSYVDIGGGCNCSSSELSNLGAFRCVLLCRNFGFFRQFFRLKVEILVKVFAIAVRASVVAKFFHCL